MPGNRVRSDDRAAGRRASPDRVDILDEPGWFGRAVCDQHESDGERSVATSFYRLYSIVAYNLRRLRARKRDVNAVAGLKWVGRFSGLAGACGR